MCAVKETVTTTKKLYHYSHILTEIYLNPTLAIREKSPELVSISEVMVLG